MSASLARHLEKLCVEIGARPIGSPANDRATDYIRDVFAALGWAVEEQAYACTGWDCAAASLVLGDEALAVEANAFSPACDVTAAVVRASTPAELAAADLTGKIALLHGELVAEPLSAKWWFLGGERDDAIIGPLETKRPVAVLAPPPPTPQYEQFTGDWELEIPAATAPLPVIERLLAQPGLLHLRLDCAKYAATARNIVARKAAAFRQAQGSSASVCADNAKRVTLMAHFDTRINTPGALDNAGSVAALLALAETLAGRELPFDLELVAFNSEEYLPIGDDEYVRRAGEASFADIPLAINMDGIGYVGGHNTVAQFNVGPALAARLEAIVARYPTMQWVDPWPQSNHSTFSFRGVPALAFSSQGAFNLAHFRADTFEKVSAEKLAEIVSVVSQIVAGCC
jgi:aminopeptidase YwaD